MKSSIFIKLILAIIFSPLFSPIVFAKDRINGLEIKNQATTFFIQNELPLSLLISDKRTFFPCSGPLSFSPRNKNDWSTVTVKCSEEDWSTLVRSQTATIGLTVSENNLKAGPLQAVVLTKNVSKGQVILEQHVALESRPERRIHGSYVEVKDVIGRKTKSNLAIGTILKARHLDRVFSVNKEDTVLVVASNNSITITTSAIALENGQIGDMIPVKNINSEKIFKVVITGKKKVAPITNM